MIRWLSIALLLVVRLDPSRAAENQAFSTLDPKERTQPISTSTTTTTTGSTRSPLEPNPDACCAQAGALMLFDPASSAISACATGSIRLLSASVHRFL
jgi:hypothetical protein